MKINGSIKFIGILGIIFGVFGLLNSISQIAIITMYATNPEIGNRAAFSPAVQTVSLPLAYTGVLIYLVYLASGIFFLLKKSFSVKLMSIALIMSIAYILLPLLLINKSYTNGFLFDYTFQLSKLKGAALDIVLFAGVALLRKNYFVQTDELTSPKTSSSPLLKIMTFIGILFFLIPLSLFALWQYVWDPTLPQVDNVAAFTSYLPEFLKEPNRVAYISLIFCLAAIILNSVCLKLTGTFWKTVNLLFLILSSLLMLLNIWQLM